MLTPKGIVNEGVEIDPITTPESKADNTTIVQNKDNKPQDISVNENPSYIDSISNLKQHKSDKYTAYKSIFNQWSINYTNEPFMLACEFAELYGLRCLHKNGNWRSVLKLNRPAVLTLTTDYGETLYISLLAIRGDDAYVSHQDNAFWVGLDELDRYWLGEYSILWKLPPYKSNTISPGQAKEAEWVNASLDRIRGSNAPRSQYLQRKAIDEEPLEAKIKRFQLKSGLVPDGILGSMTLIHINSQLDLDLPTLLGGA